MQPYDSAFEPGMPVRVRTRAELETFRAAWRYHHPLAPEQIEYAGKITRVTEVGYYHGGDVLYKLDNVPGIWHEQCLAAV